jgi:formate dehydrogenase major subunit
MTAKSPAIVKLSPHNFVQVNPADALELNIKEGETIKVSSPRGSVRLPAVLTDVVGRGVVAMPFHWGEGANVLSDASALVPASKIPGLKLTGVRIEREA